MSEEILNAESVKTDAVEVVQTPDSEVIPDNPAPEVKEHGPIEEIKSSESQLLEKNSSEIKAPPPEENPLEAEAIDPAVPGSSSSKDPISISATEEKRPAISGTDQRSNSNATRSKKPLPAKAKKHIIDELDLELTKHYSIPILNSITPPAKYPQSKDFIKKNIQRSQAFLSKAKSPVRKEEDKANEMIDETNKRNSKTIDVNERFYKKAEDYKKKKDEMKEKSMKEELDACTFQPKTNSNVKDKVKQSPREFNKKLDDYLEKKKKQQESALVARNKDMQEKQDADEDLTYKPKICEKSKLILSKKPSAEGPIHERLYNQYKNQANKQLHELEKDKDKEHPADPNKTIDEPEVFFQPTINKKSHNIARPDKIDKILYDDAIRRKNKPPQTPLSPVHKFMNVNSEKVLIDKFKREFNEALIELNMQESEKINYNQVLELFRILDFIREENEEQDRGSTLKVWKIFTEEEDFSVPKDSILAVSMGIMGLFEDWMSADTLETFKVSREEAAKLHKRFEQLYKNKISVAGKNNINQSSKNAADYSFQPERITQNDELADKWRNSHREAGKIEDTLLAEHAKKEKKLKQLKQKFEAEQLKECSFKPKTEELPASYIRANTDYSKISESLDPKSTHKGIILYTLANKNKEKKEKIAKTSKEMQEEKELEQCTFSPQILDKTEGRFNSFMQRMQTNDDNKKKKSATKKILTAAATTRAAKSKEISGKNLEILAEEQGEYIFDIGENSTIPLTEDNVLAGPIDNPIEDSKEDQNALEPAEHITIEAKIEAEAVNEEDKIEKHEEVVGENSTPVVIDANIDQKIEEKETEDANDTAVVEVVSADIERDQTVEDKGGLPDTSNGERIIPDGINDDEANKRLEEDKEYRENEELSGKENQEIKAEVTEVLPEENKTTVEIDEGPKTSEDIISE